MAGGIFLFIQILKTIMYAKSGDPDQTSLSVASGLWPTKRTLDLYGLIFHNIKVRKVQEPEN